MIAGMHLLTYILTYLHTYILTRVATYPYSYSLFFCFMDQEYCLTASMPHHDHYGILSVGIYIYVVDAIDEEWNGGACWQRMCITIAMHAKCFRAEWWLAAPTSHEYNAVC